MSAPHGDDRLRGCETWRLKWDQPRIRARAGDKLVLVEGGLHLIRSFVLQAGDHVARGEDEDGEAYVIRTLGEGRSRLIYSFGVQAGDRVYRSKDGEEVCMIRTLGESEAAAALLILPLRLSDPTRKNLRPSSISKPITARSDDGALFELLADVDCIMPKEGDLQ